MFGKIQLEQFTGLTSMPQKAASAWYGAGMDKLSGKGYKPLIYLGSQLVHGTIHYFIAEQTDAHPPFERRVIKLPILELDGEYKFLSEQISVIAG